MEILRTCYLEIKKIKTMLEANYLLCASILNYTIFNLISAVTVVQLLLYVTNGTIQCAINWHEWVWG